MDTLEEQLLLGIGSVQGERGKEYTADGAVDIWQRPVLKQNTGNWKACSFLLGAAFFWGLADYVVANNLFGYLTGDLREGDISAMGHIASWQGTCCIAILFGAFIADAFWGRGFMLSTFFPIHNVGTCMLFLAHIIVFGRSSSAYLAHVSLFFSGLCLVGSGIGVISPCLLSFAAYQFDDADPAERVKRSTLFNWFYFVIKLSAFISSVFLVWSKKIRLVESGLDIASLLGFFSVAIYSFGERFYRHQIPGGNPLSRICQVLAAAYHKRKWELPEDTSQLCETQGRNSIIQGSRKLEHTERLRCLDKAAIISDAGENSSDLPDPFGPVQEIKPCRLCTITEVEELKSLIYMFPIWVTGIIFSVVHVQASSLFVKQGTLMSKRIGSFDLPLDYLPTFGIISVLFWVLMSDRILAPIMRKFAHERKALSTFLRMGIGIFMLTLSLSVAALVETKRLQKKTAHSMLPIVWLAPQYLLLGAAEAFTSIGLLEFFYVEAPDALRTLCTALSLVTSSLGHYLSSVSLGFSATLTTGVWYTRGLSDDLIEAHIRVIGAFFKGHLCFTLCILMGVNVFNFLVYLFFAKKYKPKKVSEEKGRIVQSYPERFIIQFEGL